MKKNFITLKFPLSFYTEFLSLFEKVARCFNFRKRCFLNYSKLPQQIEFLFQNNMDSLLFKVRCVTESKVQRNYRRQILLLLFVSYLTWSYFFNKR
ncbi:MAG: hypothetical protein D6748_01370 [Calditrichaeota bacterium]|nr:MAG: hypothetical protein D6748_01370 [Calditrichota bacterium]